MTKVKSAGTAKKAKELSNEFAVIRTGGKQYVVQAGDRLDVEKLEGEVGGSLTFSDVLLVSTGQDTKIGTPVLAGAEVKAKILAQGRGAKVIIYKKKRTTGYTKRQGHRQSLTTLSVESIKA